MKDISNMRFGRQIAVKPVSKNKYGNILWLCKCDCGNEHIVSSGKLVQRKSMSCGCLKSEKSRERLEKHGITSGGKPRTLIIWNGMKARCYNPKSISYKSYGARGIRICDEWLGEQGFENFHNWAMANGYNDEFQIDRIDNNGNYEPLNCQWIPAHQNRTKQRKARYFELYGLRLNVSQWCRKLEISKSTAYKLLNESDEQFINFIKHKMINNKFLGEEVQE